MAVTPELDGLERDPATGAGRTRYRTLQGYCGTRPGAPSDLTGRPPRADNTLGFENDVARPRPAGGSQMYDDERRAIGELRAKLHDLRDSL